ncbi:uncharacterized protein LOC111699773 [Eurytemora carolleeae]|uniref:uncharacterized protein LOC111699773 n=1 Tax=Eurytemora carolleeae TaxID=1294199 RepID=UPI000C75DF31|nr:uncharacterized protein LOC111699773 [Eurytemora carolleeae]|eukprot:XP_023326273.1 uncharacterized protein LOC111699773 [Eurytemora affinis]
MQRKILDSHFHIFDLEVRAKYPNQNASMGFPSSEQERINRTHSAEEAEKTLTAANIHEGVFVQCYNNCPEEIDWVFNQFKDKTFVKGVVGGLDPLNQEQILQIITKYSGSLAPKFVGIRHLIGFEDDDYLAREDVHKGLQIIADHGLTFDIQSYPQTIKHIQTVAKQVPKLKMVIDHIGKPFYDEPSTFSAWCEDIRSAAKYPNVYCKLSGLINEVPNWNLDVFQPYIDHLIKEFGVKRCMFGSDWPVCMLASPEIEYRDVIALLEDLLKNLTNEEKDDIFYNNAKRFYGL